jgi:tight adherence protein C
MALIFILLGVLIFIIISALAFLFINVPGNEVKRISGNPKTVYFSSSKLLRDLIRISQKVGIMIPRPPEEMSKLQKQMAMAGFRNPKSAARFYGAKIILALILTLLLAAIRPMDANPILYPILSLVFSCIVLDVWLRKTIAVRQENIQLALPDALDLMLICSEAGLSMDASLGRITQQFKRIYPDLIDEIEVYSSEAMAKLNKEEALHNLGNRSGTDDLKLFSNRLIQASQMGGEISKFLREFSKDMRVKRKQRLTERANKMSIKMIPVLVFFILPAIFIVEVGPAFLLIIDTFAKTGK